jgi:hypothetical protein
VAVLGLALVLFSFVVVLAVAFVGSQLRRLRKPAMRDPVLVTPVLDRERGGLDTTPS